MKKIDIILLVSSNYSYGNQETSEQSTTCTNGSYTCNAHLNI